MIVCVRNTRVFIKDTRLTKTILDGYVTSGSFVQSSSYKTAALQNESNVPVSVRLICKSSQWNRNIIYWTASETPEPSDSITGYVPPYSSSNIDVKITIQPGDYLFINSFGLYDAALNYELRF